MHDPFLPAPPPLVRASLPLAQALHLRTLPLHMHEILPAFCIYAFLGRVASPLLSARLFPAAYGRLPARTRHNWDVHVVSLLQSLAVNGLTLWLLYADADRRRMDWRERVWGYSGATGMVQGFATGYFLWDLLVSVADPGLFGWGAVAHAGSALAVSLLGFRPFVNYYGLNFVLYELSTPFLNIHWFLDKLGMTGSWAQLVNGVVLITTFACSRLLWGTYQSVNLYRDVWRAMQTPAELPVPRWLALAYLASNTVLSVLNVYWFGRMVRTVRARFQNPQGEKGGRGDKED
ncbi:hypothetical protein MMC26_001237 [Xylographa opegraphella]|nr:hypothetical protein [Xylographa opegraphella]